mmetsp:Transcript_20547/g.28717  ORF Transcript_20547/g.28717 Transcript_20547/m.28717 type:complete len:656 (+) Transcript_20547:142-2109(+)|eukprot:CAMPEP_0184488474 /NCGR_PEP_ID=MMETSP0113_2-20130426/12143_1 /TAXON_ID=91329 /ORGANISM="Norrisiella sphaerica, Strain BC52" /LENGTH=655 /DNA_ID=CAMNT_0026871289 /DNA_START=135 /DNA_END=2102 /DNA_ORIENTATION=-
MADKFASGVIGQAIVHVGLGNFSRAHLAYFTNKYQDKFGPSEWGICAVDRDSPRTRETIEYLRKRGFHYPLITRGADSKKRFGIRSIRDFVNMGLDPKEAVNRLCLPTTRICSLTITEKGYCCDVNTGDLVVDNPEIKHDLENISKPKSAIGLICSALQTRRLSGLAPFTVMSCDNLPGNGHVTENAVTQFAALLDPTLERWIREYVAFPNTMVDRITPQTASAESPIVSEDFAQWVVEDKFTNGRPLWESLEDVLVVDDVIPYEKMKVRMLNGSHSALSYLSYLCGYRDVDHALAVHDVHDFVQMYLEEVATTVPAVPGVDLAWYQKKLLERFSNPNIKDQVQRLAEDGSTKLKTTMLPVIFEMVKEKNPSPMVALAIAGWIRYMSGVDDFGNEIKITDPMEDKLRPLAQYALAQGDVMPFMVAAFGAEELAKMKSFPKKVQAWYSRLLSEGPWRVLDSLDEFAFGFADFGDSQLVNENPFAGKNIQDIVRLTIMDLEKMFNTYDADKNGYLDLDEIKHLLQDFVARLKEEIATTDIYSSFGIAKDADVNPNEIIKTALAALPDPEDEATVKLLMARLDSNEDGKISLEEFVGSFGDIVRIRYHQILSDVSAPRQTEITEVKLLPPPTFGASWSAVNEWVREENAKEEKANASA